MHYIFGPLPSRRLGQSLGIDPLPLKTCNWNCVYCQLGRSRPLVNDRRVYVPLREILAEVEQVLSTYTPGEVDWVTVVGSGEPTLYSELGALIRRLKRLSNLPVAVITNGALLYLPDVRQQLQAADAVLPSLDAGNPVLYRKINRPWPKLTFDRLLDGLISFRKEYTGKLWVELMLLRGLNDDEKALREIAAAINLIHPDEVHINLPVRPPTELWVQHPDEEAIMRSRAILGNLARIIRPIAGTFNLNGRESLAEAILSIISRHPMHQDELQKVLARWSPNQVREILLELQRSGRAKLVERIGERFWSAAQSYYPPGR